MILQILLLGILPLLAFVIIDSFAGLRAGVIGGILFALIETIYSLVYYQTIDSLTLGSTALVIFFGLLSYKSQKEIYFKLQPVIIGIIFVIILSITQILEKPLLVTMLQKYQYMLPENMRLIAEQKAVLDNMAQLSGVLIWGFLAHALLVAYAAFRMNKYWWLLIRGIGFYLMLFICAFFVRFTA